MASNLGLQEVINSQFNDLVTRYPALMLRWEDQCWIVEGDLHFRATFNDVPIEDVYSIRIAIPSTYPTDIPTTSETGGRIPVGFHKYTDGSLCLETRTMQHIKFSANQTLLFYVEKFVVEYLYGYSHLQNYGVLPFGERAHDAEGILESYKDLFATDDAYTALHLLYILSSETYRGHQACPCGSNKKLRICHGKTLLPLLSLGLKVHFSNDFVQLYKLMPNAQRRK